MRGRGRAQGRGLGELFGKQDFEDGGWRRGVGGGVGVREGGVRGPWEGAGPFEGTSEVWNPWGLQGGAWGRSEGESQGCWGDRGGAGPLQPEGAGAPPPRRPGAHPVPWVGLLSSPNRWASVLTDPEGDPRPHLGSPASHWRQEPSHPKLEASYVLCGPSPILTAPPAPPAPPELGGARAPGTREPLEDLPRFDPVLAPSRGIGCWATAEAEPAGLLPGGGGRPQGPGAAGNKAGRGLCWW